MVIGNFSDIEARKDIQKDRDELIRFFDSVIERAEYQRKVKKATRFPFTYIATFKSSRGNRYKVLFTPTDKKSGLKNPILSVYTSLEKEEGTYILRYDWVKNNVAIYTPHFFRRYRERFLKDEALSSGEVRDKFLLRNQNVTSSSIEEGEDIGTCKDGYIYIRRKDKHTNICVTFVSPDLLTEEQLKDRTELLKVLREHEEKVLKHEDNVTVNK